METFDSQKRFKHYKKLADQGDAEAQVIVGEDFEYGESVEISMESALHYYRLSAEQNFPRAFFHLAECYAEGKGIEKSVEQAIKYYELAADRGDVLAQATLGNYLMKNRINMEKGIQHLKSAIQNKQCPPKLLSFTQYNLGKYCENGLGIKQLDQDALYYYKLAADGGNDLAQDRLGVAYLQGELGVEKSAETAIHYFQLAADQGLSFSMTMLGMCYGRGEGVEQSSETAFHWFKQAAKIEMQKGYGTSILALAQCYELGIGTDKSLQTAIQYYKLAAENGVSIGYYKVGCCYQEMGSEENKKTASAYFKMADEGEKIHKEEKLKEMKLLHHIKEGVNELKPREKECSIHFPDLNKSINVKLVGKPSTTEKQQKFNNGAPQADKNASQQGV